MSTAPSVSIETPTIIPRLRSRRIWYVLIAGVVVALIGLALRERQIQKERFVTVSRQMQDESMTSADGRSSVDSPVILRHVQNAQLGSASGLNALQNRQPSGVTYANQSQPQDPDENRATVEINQLRNQLRSASGDQQKTLRKALTEAVGKLFDLRHAAQAKQVENLEAELAEAKELHKKRSERKDEIVERRIAELLQSADDLAWNRGLAVQPNPTPNYSYGQWTPQYPNNVYSGPIPSDAYQASPYGPRYAPHTGPVNPNSVPQSSTPPQFVPLTAPNSGQTNLLQSAPRSTGENPYADSAVSSADPNNVAPLAQNPAIATSNTRAAKPNQHVAETNAEVTLADDLLGTAVSKPSKAETIALSPLQLNDASMNSRVVIEAAYAYEEALEVVIEAKKLAARGVYSSRELSSFKRNAAKANAIWAGMCRDLAKRKEVKRRELDGRKALLYENSSLEKRTERELELAKLEVDYQSLQETQSWVEEFKTKSIDPLQKQFEQSDEKKDDEKKPDAPSEINNP